ncbi:hypothetical protein J6590_062836 [Homalodisca vitripennis]|nr:hypothetical protein J6590_062836 [Homalodisca vitripennis]
MTKSPHGMRKSTLAESETNNVRHKRAVADLSSNAKLKLTMALTMNSMFYHHSQVQQKNQMKEFRCLANLKVVIQKTPKYASYTYLIDIRTVLCVVDSIPSTQWTSVLEHGR